MANVAVVVLTDATVVFGLDASGKKAIAVRQGNILGTDLERAANLRVQYRGRAVICYPDNLCLCLCCEDKAWYLYEDKSC